MTRGKTGGLVLVVDDEPSIRLVVSRYLAQRGFACEVAESLAEARRMARVRSYDAAVVDVMLPDGDGVRFAAELRAKSPALKLVLVSALDLWRVAARDADGARPFAYLQKPFELAALEKAMAEA